MAASPLRGNKVMYLVNAKEFQSTLKSVPEWMVKPLRMVEIYVEKAMWAHKAPRVFIFVLFPAFIFTLFFFTARNTLSLNEQRPLLIVCGLMLSLVFTMVLIILFRIMSLDDLKIRLEYNEKVLLDDLGNFLNLPDLPSLKEKEFVVKQRCREYLSVLAFRVEEKEDYLRGQGVSDPTLENYPELFILRHRLDEALLIMTNLQLVDVKKGDLFRKQKQSDGGMTGF